MKISYFVVSVIIPTFNESEKLLLLLKSLENQTVNNFEIIVVDDGSTDDTKEAVEGYISSSNLNISYFYLDNTNIFGAGLARNYGAKKARGNILIFLDQDNVAERTLVESYLKIHEKEDIILGYYSGYNNNKNLYYNIKELEDYVDEGKKITRIIPDFRDNEFNNKSRKEAWKVFVSANFSIKKKLFLNYLFDEQMISWGCEDVEFGYRLVRDGNLPFFCRDCITYNSSNENMLNKDKFISLMNSLIYFYEKHKTDEIKDYCMERFVHSPYEYRINSRLDFIDGKLVFDSGKLISTLSGTRKKIIFYCVNGIGLGHLTRTLTLAEALRELNKDIDILIVTNSKFVNLVKEKGFNFFQLEYKPNHAIHPNQVQEFIGIIDNFNPSSIVYDTYFNEDVVDYCDSKNIKNILVLRKKDDQSTKELLNSPIINRFSQVLLPNLKEESNIDDNLVRSKNFKFTGPIVKRQTGDKNLLKKKYDINKNDFVITATCGGGGQDEYNIGTLDFLNTVHQAYDIIKDKINNLKFIIIKGPYSDFKSDQLPVIDFEPNLMALLSISDICISTAGYNVCNELIISKSPSILFPLPRHEEFQKDRSERLENLGVAKLLHNLDANELAEMILNLYKNRDKLSNLKQNLENVKISLGNEKAARIINESLDSKFYHLKLGPKCNNNCIFCKDLNIKADYEKSLDDIKEELDNIKQKDYSHLVLPCNSDIRKDFLEILKYAKKLKFKITLKTNGRMFSYEKIALVTNKYVDNFEIFINGPKKIHDKISETSSFEQTVRGIGKLASLKADLQINLVITNANYLILSSIIHQVKDLGIKNIKLIYLDKERKAEYIPSVIDSYDNILESIFLAEKLNLNLIKDDLSDFFISLISNEKIYSGLLDYNFLEKTRLDCSTICSLECPACFNGKGKMKDSGVGAGYLKYSDFKNFVNNNPQITEIELSNLGDIFSNPELNQIFQYAYLKNIRLTIKTGVHLNNVDEALLESLVKYRIRSIRVSIDGACQEIYSIYRQGGNFDNVIENIKKINHYKRKYSSKFPELTWQFIIFGHNEYEIHKARQMAKDLDMEFYLKFNHSPEYSPVRDLDFVRKETGLGVASRDEFRQKYKKNFILPCDMFWFSPQINWDGKLLGCCSNLNKSMGNVFKSGLKNCLNSEKYIYAKRMILGLEKKRNDIPCSHCKHYIKGIPYRQLKETLLSEFLARYKYINSSKRNIFFLKSHFFLSTEIFIYNEITNLRKFKPFVLTFNKNSYLADTIPTLEVKKPFVKNQILESLHCDKPSLFHAQFGTDALDFLSLKDEFNIPLVTSFRGFDVYRFPKENPDCYKLLFEKGDVFLPRSEIMKKDLIKMGCPENKIIVHHTGIGVEKFKYEQRKPNNIMKFLSICRFVEKKGIIYLIKAFHKLACENKNVFLTLVGLGFKWEDKKIRKEIFDYISENNLQDRISIKNIVSYDEIQRLYYDHHIFVLPSITAKDGDKEGIPNVLKEAMATGMPVISTYHSGIPELIKDKYNGFLVKERDVDELYRKMKYMVENFDNCQLICEKARKTVEDYFNLEKQTKELEKIYDQLLQKNNCVIKSSKDFPRSATIRITENCNAKCKMCHRWTKNHEQELSTEKILDILLEMKQLGISSIFFTGGEPTSRKDFLEILAKAKKLGFSVEFVTNGSNLNKDYVEKLSEIGLNALKVSIDSADKDLHDSLRGVPGIFDVATNGMLEFKKINPEAKLSISTLVFRNNYKDLDKMVDLAKRLGINHIHFTLAHIGMVSDSKYKEELSMRVEDLKDFYFNIVPKILLKKKDFDLNVRFSPFFVGLVGKSVDGILHELKNNRLNFEKEIKQFSNEIYGKEMNMVNNCKTLSKSFQIKADGSITPCCNINSYSDAIMGDVNQSSLKDIWFSEKYQNFRNSNNKPIHNQCFICKNQFDFYL